MREHDFDWIVIGSGFGGSVSALRLAEKGYKVAVLEAGRRYRDEDFAKTTWNARRYYWLPRLGLRGIFRMTLFKDVFVVSGCGVGGGSLGYANTLYRPRAGSAFYRDPQWAGLDDWEAALAPHYETAERMLGVTSTRARARPTRCCASSPSEMGVAETYSTTRVGVFFGEPGHDRARPLLRRRGPAARRLHPLRRAAWSAAATTPRTRCPRTTSTSPSARACEVLPERTVAEVRPLGAADGSDGYRVTSERSGAWSGRTADADRQGRRRRRGPARHQPAAPALPDRRRAAAALRAHRLPRAHQLRGDLRRHHPRRAPRLHEVDRDHLELLSRRGHAHRERHLRRRGGLDLAAVHRPRRHGAQPLLARARCRPLRGGRAAR